MAAVIATAIDALAHVPPSRRSGKVAGRRRGVL